MAIPTEQWLDQAARTKQTLLPSATFRHGIFLHDLFFYGIFAALALVLLAVQHPPLLQDYPDWVYEGVLFSHTLTGHSDNGYVFHAFPIPNSFSTWGLGLLDLLLGWQLAAKIWLLTLLTVAAYAIRALAVQLRAHSVWICCVAPTLVILNMSFWTGNVNFLFAMAFILLLIVQILRVPTWRTADIAGLAGTLVLIFFCHMIVCAAALLILVTFARQTRKLELLLAAIPVGLLILWYKIGLFVHPVGIETLADETPVAYGTLDFAMYKANALLKSLGCVNVLDVTQQASITIRLLRAPAFLLMLAAYVTFSLALLCTVAQGWKHHRLQRTQDQRPDTRFLWNTVIILLMVSVLLPSYMLDVFNPGYKCLQIALAIAAFVAVPSTVGKLTGSCVVVMGCAVLSATLNITQLAIVQANPGLAGALDAHVPQRVGLNVTWVAPYMRQDYYESLANRQMDRTIFISGLYQEARSVTAP